MTGLKASAAPAIVLAGAIAVVGVTVHRNDPIGDWLVWWYLGFIAMTLTWGLACLAMGFRIARWVGATTLPLRECLLQAFGIGVLASAFATIAVGLVGGLGGVSFALIPFAFLLLGLPELWAYLKRARRHLKRTKPAGATVLGVIAMLFGLACLGGLYFIALTPDNLAYDSRWYHLPIAEHYASLGRVERFEEGWYLGALPHLASYLYTWAFTLPTPSLFAHIELAVHVEFLLVLVTVFALPVLVDRLMPRPRVRSGWAAFFLFPGILLYDSAPSGAADHVLAFWAIPVFLAFLRFFRKPRTRDGVVLGIALGGAFLSKYQSMYVLAFPILAVALAFFWRLAFARQRLALPATFVLGAAFLGATSPHWLLHLIWHGSPLYPMWGGHPFVAGIDRALPLDPRFVPQGSFLEKVRSTVGGIARFGFEVNDWPTLHGSRIIFGALLYPAAALIPFAKRWRLLLLLFCACVMGIAAWYWTYHVDRYLQALTPWFAALVLPALVGVWRRAPFARPLIAGLVVLQVLACADLLFLPTHAMLGTTPVHKTVDLLSSTHRKAFGERTVVTAVSYAKPLLPANAKVLVHEMHLHLGLGAPAVHDDWGRQAGINYSELGSPREIAAHLRKLGVTHVLWQAPVNWSRFPDDVAFYWFANSTLKPQRLPSGLDLAPLPADVPASAPNPVLVLSCTAEAMGTSQLTARWAQMVAVACPAAEPVDWAKVLPAAQVVVVDVRRYGGGVPPEVMQQFQQLFVREGTQVWGRRP